MNFFKAEAPTSEAVRKQQIADALIKQLEYAALAEDFEAQADDARNRARILGLRIARLTSEAPSGEVHHLRRPIGFQNGDAA